MLKTSAHSGGDSAAQRSLESLVASDWSGMPLGPDMPALATKRQVVIIDVLITKEIFVRLQLTLPDLPSKLMCFSLDFMSLTNFSKSALDVTSQGPILSKISQGKYSRIKKTNSRNDLSFTCRVMSLRGIFEDLNPTASNVYLST